MLLSLLSGSVTRCISPEPGAPRGTWLSRGNRLSFNILLMSSELLFLFSLLRNSSMNVCLDWGAGWGEGDMLHELFDDEADEVFQDED